MAQAPLNYVKITGTVDIGAAFPSFNAQGFGSFGTYDRVGLQGSTPAFGGDLRATFPIGNGFGVTAGAWGKGFGSGLRTNIDLDPFVPGRESTLSIQRQGFAFPYIGVTYNFTLPVTMTQAAVTFGAGPRFEYQTRSIQIVQAGLTPTYDFSGWSTAPTLFLDTDFDVAKLSPSSTLVGRIGAAVDFQRSVDYSFITPLGIPNRVSINENPTFRFYVGLGVKFDTGTMLLNAQ